MKTKEVLSRSPWSRRCRSDDGNPHQEQQEDEERAPLNDMGSSSNAPPASKQQQHPPILSSRNSFEEFCLSNSNSRTAVDCLICLNPMRPSDLAHPLMCPSPSCCFNFCCNCIENLMEQQRQASQEKQQAQQRQQKQQQQQRSSHLHRHHRHANHHTNINRTFSVDSTHSGESTSTSIPAAIFLNCPNCRSALGPTVCDTVLLRKVDRIAIDRDHEKEHGGSGIEGDDAGGDHDQLLALRKAMDADLHLLQEIADARDREARFWKVKYGNTVSSSSAVGQLDTNIIHPDEQRDYTETLSSDDEEWGFEVDMRIGAHESIKLPRRPSMFPVLFGNDGPKADTTLLAGLENTMSEFHQEKITKLLTSGDSSDLVQGAQMLSSFARSVRSNFEQQCVQSPDFRLPGRLSVYQVIEDGKSARRKLLQSSSNSSTPPSSPNKQQQQQYKKVPYHDTHWHTKSVAQKAAQHKEMKLQLRTQAAYLRRHPLPTRMPKFARFRIVRQDTVAQLVKKLPVRFCNDTWDGTVLDAYSKIYISRDDGEVRQKQKKQNAGTFVDNYKVTKSPPSDHIRDVMGGETRMDVSHPRIVIASVVDETASRQGILKGDILTHLNGVELKDAYVDDVLALLYSLLDHSENGKEDGEEEGSVEVEMVLNADLAVARALKMRAAATKTNL